MHFARFMRVGPDEQVLFTSYYDGSLESYNNDFVDQVAWVLNTVFGQQAGYPRTRWMVHDGAHNERWFKNFIRGHQVPTQVWYSAYPDLPAVTIDQNARLRAGLSGELEGEDAGRMAANPLKKKAAVDTADVQGLVLQGYGKHRAAAYLVLEVTDGRLARGPGSAACSPRSRSARVGRPGAALNLALTSSGLAKLGLPSATLSGFSLEFLEGMTSAHRSRLLGDEGAAAPAHWSWGAPDGPEVDLLLLVFAQRRGCARTRCSSAIGRAGRRLDCARSPRSTRRTSAAVSTSASATASRSRRCPASADAGRRGTRSHRGSSCSATSTSTGSTRAHPSCPAPRTPAACCRRVPTRPAGAVAPVPSELEDAHDFGRNGSYLVVRTLVQDVGGFWGVRRPRDPAARRRAPTRTRVRRWPPGWSDAGRAVRR